MRPSGERRQSDRRCSTRSDTGRVGYGAGDATWVPDCQNPLLREYWRVDTNDGKTAYTLPRMDGEPLLQPACGSDQDDLHHLVERYDLCAAAATDEQVKVINSIALGDALELTHFLHGQLKFAPSADGMSIAPFPIPGDILDACALHASSTELRTMCDREQENLMGGLALTYTGPGAVELVARLNELYGIP